MEFARTARALADRYDREAAGEDIDEAASSGSEDEGDMVDRMDLFMPVVQRLVGALGGYEVSTRHGHHLSALTNASRWLNVTGHREPRNEGDRDGVSAR
jgi:hypothetical protein